MSTGAVPRGTGKAKRRHPAALLAAGFTPGPAALIDFLIPLWAGLGGVGGALLWVSLRAIVSERLATDSGVFVRLMSVQEAGTWVAFVAGLTLLGRTDLFEPVLLACAGACLIGAVMLFASPSRTVPKDVGHSAREMSTRAVTRRVRPMLITSAATAAAEAAVSILLLLHLQRGFGLGVIETAYVFLPGAVALAVLPPLLHKVVVRTGRRRAVITASVASAAFAASLAWAPSPVMIAALWILSGLAWAVLMPIEQAVVAEAVPDSVGSAMGVYTAVGLLSAAAGALAAGFVYDYVSWQAACLVSAVMILTGAVLGPSAIRRLGVGDMPTEETVPAPRG